MTTSTQLPDLDTTSRTWLGEVHKASLNSLTCCIPPKYFDVLLAWGYVTGAANAAKISGTGLALQVEAEQAAKSTQTKKRKH